MMFSLLFRVPEVVARRFLLPFVLLFNHVVSVKPVSSTNLVRILAVRSIKICSPCEFEEILINFLGNKRQREREREVDLIEFPLLPQTEIQNLKIKLKAKI